MVGTVASDSIVGSWTFANKKSKKTSEFEYKRDVDERESDLHTHPACLKQNMSRVFLDVDTVEKGLYKCEHVSPVFFGVEGDGIIKQQCRDHKSVKGSSLEGVWEGHFILTLSNKGPPIQVEEWFRLRTGFGPNNCLSKSELEEQCWEQVIGRGTNEFGGFTIAGKFNKQTKALNLMKVYDPPVVKRRARCTSSADGQDVEASRTSKRQRKVSQKVLIKSQQEEAMKKAEEDAERAKKQRQEERRLLKLQRLEEERQAIKERAIREEERSKREAERQKREEEQRLIAEKEREEELEKCQIVEQNRLADIEIKRLKVKELAAFAVKLEERRQAATIKVNQNSLPNLTSPVPPLFDVSVIERPQNRTSADMLRFSSRVNDHSEHSATSSSQHPSREMQPYDGETSSDEDDCADGTERLVATVWKGVDNSEYRTAHKSVNGEIYEGQFKNGLRDGLGTCVYTNGDMYEGEWKDGIVHGKGLITDKNGNFVCDGEFHEGRLNGKATFQHADGSKYVGDWRENRRHGYGTYNDSDGNVYRGEWKDNLRQGHGISTDISGNSFEGEWFKDMRHGPGNLKGANGTLYEGVWKNNQLEGRGIILYPDGSRYEGTLRGGIKDGRGMYIFASKAEYEGRFRDDRIHGMGTLRMEKSVSVTKYGGKYVEEMTVDDGHQEIEATSSDLEMVEECMIPIDMQKDLPTVHFIAGFDRFGN